MDGTSDPWSHEIVHWILIALIGAGVGYLGGLFGKGGSAIATPFLAVIGVPPILAVASPLPATIPGTLVAFRRYQREGYADRRVIAWSVAFGAPATVIGAIVTRWVGGDILVTITDGIVACLGLRVLLSRHASCAAETDTTAPTADTTNAARPVLDRRDARGGVVTLPAPPAARTESHAIPVAPPALLLAAVALSVGFLAGLLANSGGFLLVPLYLAVLTLPIKNALACSLAVASLLAVPGTIVHAALGHIDWRIAIVFGAASIPLSGLGARTALRMNAARLERFYGAGLFVLGAGLLLFR
ncbi:MAG: hypothetical protein JWM34_5020 [Ilumatobacteraceae bacterium]|nr:hypothetical protein [Ilumatobacteraceae bacterium]